MPRGAPGQPRNKQRQHGTISMYVGGCRCEPCRAAESVYRKAWYRRHPEKSRQKHLRRTYGIEQSDYNLLLDGQHGACAICRRRLTRTLHVDHDHVTGAVRGLLCLRCNTSLPWFETYFASIVEYLA